MSLSGRMHNRVSGIQALSSNPGSTKTVTLDPVGRWVGNSLRVFGLATMAGSAATAAVAAAPVGGTVGALITAAMGLGGAVAGGIAVVKGDSLARRSVTTIPNPSA